jgi:hypothetical protein
MARTAIVEPSCLLPIVQHIVPLSLKCTASLHVVLFHCVAVLPACTAIRSRIIPTCIVSPMGLFDTVDRV